MVTRSQPNLFSRADLSSLWTWPELASSVSRRWMITPEEKKNPKSCWKAGGGEKRWDIGRTMERVWNEKRKREGWLKQTESESTYSHRSPCLLFSVTPRQELIGQLSASAPSAARRWEQLHCRASSNTAGNLSFCQRKGFFSPPPYFFCLLLLNQHFSKQIQHKPAIWYSQGAKCCIFSIINSLAYSFREISLITINKHGVRQDAL